MFEETSRTLFCSDLFHHNGQVEPLTESDVVDRTRQTLIAFQQTARLRTTFPTPPRPAACCTALRT